MTGAGTTEDPASGSVRSKGIKRTPEREAAIGARIRAFRTAARMSQSVLGQAVGISLQQVQKYESGRDRVAASTLQGFATALGVHPGAFYDDMPALVGTVSDRMAAVKAGAVLQRIRNPHVLKQLLALAEALAEERGSEEDRDGAGP